MSSVLRTAATSLKRRSAATRQLVASANSTAARCFSTSANRFGSSTSIPPSSASFQHNDAANQLKFQPIFRQQTRALSYSASSPYAEGIYSAWKADPSSVHKSWDAYFRAMEGQGYANPTTTITTTLGEAPASGANVTDSLRLLLLVRAYESLGHLAANLDPLKVNAPRIPPQLDYKFYGFTDGDLDRTIQIGDNIISGFLSANSNVGTLRQLIKRLQEVYCGTIGVEFSHIEDRQMCNWIRERLETPQQYQFSKEDKLHILDRLIWAASFEQFLAIKFATAKRFGLEGCESLIPGMKALIDDAANLGVEAANIGMPHRGRLNVLANVLRKPLEAILNEFPTTGPKKTAPISSFFSGDVKYHLGTSYDRPTRYGKQIHLSLLCNPSHLEAVDPVVEGKTRAKQYYMGDTKHEKVMSIQLHGDASFAGQGVVYEVFDQSIQKDYTTGGVVHIVVNNQIGFTTDPRKIRDTPHPTGVAHCFNVPVFHVNADDPEAVVRVFKMAAEWRQTFHTDIVIDIVGYRRFGHNEADNPKYTQPLMYQKIDNHPPSVKLYADKLISEGVITQQEVDAMFKRTLDEYNRAFEASKSYEYKPGEWLSSKWKGFKGPEQLARIKNTGVPMEALETVTKAISTWPADFTPHPMIAKIMRNRGKACEPGAKHIDWATAEALAFGTLLLEGNHVRLSGQDVERGTFSHRHAIIVDQVTGNRYFPLSHIPGAKEKISITNSSLSEYGALGFELGYSLENPNALVMWEAQFGDFANGAQIIIDQFISSGEAKWMRQSGLVLLLPHGYEGQGPEHSSARLERFLQMSDENPDVIPDMDITRRKQIQECNYQVVNCTTPANYFHVLRRQVHREFRKPLIVMTPKSLLKHPMAVSSIEEFDDKEGHPVRFQRLIPEVADKTHMVSDDKVRKVIFCSGKVYYDLVKERTARRIKDVALIRVEQLSPFPFDHVLEQILKYPNARVVWCQEEPRNMGAWDYVYFRFRTILNHIINTPELRKNRKYATMDVPEYVGRAPSAATAVGLSDLHIKQLHDFLNDAFAE